MARQRIAETFATLKSTNKKALVLYLTAGDPDLQTSVEAGLAVLAAGADILEIGLPFSDPIADGPVIQRAMQRSLINGGGFSQTLEVVQRLRAHSDAPLVVFGYINPLLWLGFEESCKRIAEAGADGLLVVDVPPEESEYFVTIAKKHGLDWVSLVAPTSGIERTGAIAQAASGFLYMISMRGVTGGVVGDLQPVRERLQAVRQAAPIPVCIGFGVRDRQSAHAVGQIADGVVVGSAAVQALEQGVEPLRQLVAALRLGVDGPVEN